MSAWPVSNALANMLATFAVDNGLCADAEAAALVLLLENRASLRGLYADADQKWPDLARLEQLFRFERRPVTAEAILGPLQAYMYQSSKHAGWLQSEACALCMQVNEIAAAAASQQIGLPIVALGPELDGLSNPSL